MGKWPGLNIWKYLKLKRLSLQKPSTKFHITLLEKVLIPSNTLATKDFTKVTIQTNLVLLEVIFKSCFYAKDPSEKTSYSA